MAEVIMPKMGDAMTEGKILRWIKHPGDRVAKGEPIAEIETDKVNVEIEAEWDGTLARLLVGEGQAAAVGAPIALIARPGESPDGQAAGAPTGPARATAQPARPPAQERVQAAAAQGSEASAVRASPLARRLAAEHGIALPSIRGTGPDGRITKEDVEAAVARAKRPSAAPAPTPPAPEAGPHAAGQLPVSRMRATIARRMTESKQHAPHFYVTVSINVDAALALRRQLNEGLAESQRISVNDLLVKAAAQTLQKYPRLNASYSDAAIQLSEDINISVAVALPDGLIAPTLYHCNRKSLWEIAADARALIERARGGHLKPEDLIGGTFTISNLGMFEVESFVAIINPPQAAILAVGAATPQAIVQGGQIAVATVMRATISADHRVTDGAEAAAFLSDLRRLLENPVWLVADRPGA
jgi:pyruvate dehydrogenase E2 component (dihydrolipoamide acetyltransferase)